MLSSCAALLPAGGCEKVGFQTREICALDWSDKRREKTGVGVAFFSCYACGRLRYVPQPSLRFGQRHRRGACQSLLCYAPRLPPLRERIVNVFITPAAHERCAHMCDHRTSSEVDIPMKKQDIVRFENSVVLYPINAICSVRSLGPPHTADFIKLQRFVV